MVTACADPAQSVEVAPAAAQPAVGPCAALSQQQALVGRLTGLQALLARANPLVASLLGCR